MGLFLSNLHEDSTKKCTGESMNQMEFEPS